MRARKPRMVLSLLLVFLAGSVHADGERVKADEEFLSKVANVPTDNASLLARLRERARMGDVKEYCERMILQLGDPSFAKREEATRILCKLDLAARPILTAHAGKHTLEIE